MITRRSIEEEEYVRFLRSSGFDLQQSAIGVFPIRRWSCVFPTSFRLSGGDDHVWLVKGYTRKGTYRKAARRRIKDLRLVANVNHGKLYRHEMKASR